MKIQNNLSWQIPYKKTLSTYGHELGIDMSVSELSEMDAQRVFAKIFDEYKIGNEPLDEAAMLCQILSEQTKEGSEIFWQLILASELDWYEKNKPSKVEFFLDSIYKYINEVTVIKRD